MNQGIPEIKLEYAEYDPAASETIEMQVDSNQLSLPRFNIPKSKSHDVILAM